MDHITLPSSIGLAGGWCLLAFRKEAWYIHASTLEVIKVAREGHLDVGGLESSHEVWEGVGPLLPPGAWEEGIPLHHSREGEWNEEGVHLLDPLLARRALALHANEAGVDPRLVMALGAVAGWGNPYGDSPGALWVHKRGWGQCEPLPPLIAEGREFRWD